MEKAKGCNLPEVEIEDAIREHFRSGYGLVATILGKAGPGGLDIVVLVNADLRVNAKEFAESLGRFTADYLKLELKAAGKKGRGRNGEVETGAVH